MPTMTERPMDRMPNDRMPNSPMPNGPNAQFLNGQWIEWPMTKYISFDTIDYLNNKSLNILLTKKSFKKENLSKKVRNISTMF